MVKRIKNNKETSEGNDKGRLEWLWYQRNYEKDKQKKKK